MQDMEMNDMWFQQDDASYHTARKTIQQQFMLHVLFPGRNFPFLIRIDQPNRAI